MASIGIIGGMGPLATVKLFEEIVLNTAANHDQEHIRIFIDNNPQIPDRTSSILKTGPDPSAEILKTAQNLLAMGADVLVMPCNTAHYFANRISELVGPRFVNMIEETACDIISKYGSDKPIVLMATMGTYEGGVYESVFSRYSIRLESPSDIEKQIVMDLISQIKRGCLDEPTDYIQLLTSYCERGLDHFILGCTELSVTNKLFHLPGTQIDPLHILATAAIRRAGGKISNHQ